VEELKNERINKGRREVKESHNERTYVNMLKYREEIEN